MYATDFIQTYSPTFFELADILGRFKSRQFLGVIALITKECRSADSNHFTFVEASCSESTLHHIFRFRTKDKEVKKLVLTLSVLRLTDRINAHSKLL